MVKVGLTNVRDLAPAELRLLTDEERERHFGSEVRRRQFCCGRSLLRLMLRNRTGIPASKQPITVIDGGKPVCAGGPAVSITHSGDVVACCIADMGEIGIDMESVDTRRSVRRIARSFFSEEEAQWLNGQPKDRFLMLWVLKEAYCKATGEGVYGGLNRLCCRVEPPRIEIAADNRSPRDVTLHSDGRHLLGLVAIGAPLEDIVIERWKPGFQTMSACGEFHLMAAGSDA